MDTKEIPKRPFEKHEELRKKRAERVMKWYEQWKKDHATRKPL